MICPLCGKRINHRHGEWSNACLVDGVLTHKKCPRKKMSPEESELYKQLLERVKYHFAYSAKGYIRNTGLNWMKLGKQIKYLYGKGYSFQDQQYVLDRVVELQEGFYGYGAVSNNIDRILTLKNQKEQMLKNIEKAHENIKKTWQPDDDDYEW